MKYVFIVFLFMSTYTIASETAVIKNAEISLLDKLKDPDSAKFYNVRILTNSQGKKAVCGQVNSKNSYGGYVGKQDFFSYESYTDVVDLDDRINTRQYKLSGCAGLELEKDAIAEDLARDGCLSNWDLIENTFINNYPQDKSINIAIEKIKYEAAINHKKLTTEIIENLKKQYRSMLAFGNNNQDFLKEIKSTSIPTIQKKGAFLSTCIPNSIQIFKKNMN
jgi:hypothetical protein